MSTYLFFCIFQSDKRARTSASTVNESHTTKCTSVHTQCPCILASQPDLPMLRCDVMCERAESCLVFVCISSNPHLPPRALAQTSAVKTLCISALEFCNIDLTKSVFPALKSPVRAGTGELGWLQGHTLTQPKELLCVF